MTNLNDRELLELIAQQVQKTDMRIDKLEQKVDKLGQKVDKLEEKFDKLEEKFDKLEQKVDKLEEKVEKNHQLLITAAEDFKTFKEIANEHEFSIRQLKRKIGS